MFPSPYPDSWGVFASRNNFAQFLELALPAALWRARTGSVFDMAAAGAMLAAGVASASRAGAALLAFETIACLALMGRGKLKKWKLAAVIAASVAVGGAGQLVGRFRQPDPLELRREIARSTLAMIRAHPLKGWGLGTFASVYPAYAEFDIGAAVEHAHDDWLEWTAEGGIGFAAAWAALAISIGVPAVRSIWGMGVLAVLAHAIVDFPFARLGIAAWVFLLIGALAARGGVREFARGEH
ncbi:MAG TPA: O-antigen ligase family protein [Bryobacteraceae bacterium]|nr:O-antigen ligase family protein [Bryobacteraceae bacterium]